MSIETLLSDPEVAAVVSFLLLGAVIELRYVTPSPMRAPAGVGADAGLARGGRLAKIRPGSLGCCDTSHRQTYIESKESAGKHHRQRRP
jgi:hypothetical protein